MYFISLYFAFYHTVFQNESGNKNIYITYIYITFKKLQIQHITIFFRKVLLQRNGKNSNY